MSAHRADLIWRHHRAFVVYFGARFPGYVVMDVDGDLAAGEVEVSTFVLLDDPGDGSPPWESDLPDAATVEAIRSHVLAFAPPVLN